MSKKIEPTEKAETLEQRVEKLEAAHLNLVARHEFHTHDRVGQVEHNDPESLAVKAEREQSLKGESSEQQEQTNG